MVFVVVAVALFCAQHDTPQQLDDQLYSHRPFGLKISDPIPTATHTPTNSTEIPTVSTTTSNVTSTPQLLRTVNIREPKHHHHHHSRVAPEHARAYKAMARALKDDDRNAQQLPETAKSRLNEYIVEKIDQLHVPSKTRQEGLDPQVLRMINRNRINGTANDTQPRYKYAIYNFAHETGMIPTANDPSQLSRPKLIVAISKEDDSPPEPKSDEEPERHVSKSRVLAYHLKNVVQAKASTDIAESSGLKIAAQSHSRACEGVSTGLSAYEQHMAFLTTGLAEELMTEMTESTGILRLILTPVVMVLMTPVVEKIKQKMSSGAANPMMDLLADLIFLPLVLLMSIAIVHLTAVELANQLIDSLTFRLTDFLAAILQRDVGTAVGEDVVAYLTLILRRIANPLLATSVGNFLMSILPQAIVDACTTAVTEAVGSKTARMLQPQVTAYLQCMYCYEKGMYCQQCWWNDDLSWQQREWFLGGDPNVGALDFDEGSY
eukprot:c7355_g1_i1.p1 GENE.c7355_g1_i1~~c7355_g1_i1.p1  ORF type:complete len:491 (-),score=141.45 c7355_g1_i1:115-1587(-)